MGADHSTALDQAGAELYLEYVNDLLNSFKAMYHDPFIIAAKDLNLAEPDIAFEDFVGFCAVPTPPTRGDEEMRCLLTCTNHYWRQKSVHLLYGTRAVPVGLVTTTL